MSYWTHIVASMHVETGIQSDNMKSVIEEKLKEAPKITGSEGPADVFVNIPSGYNFYGVCDGKRIKYQTRAVITINGDLRDRLENDTCSEFDDFVKFIKEDCDYRIRNITVNIEG